MRLKTAPALSIVICDFDGWKQTQLCLAALGRSRFSAFDIFVVDHGTTDATRRGLAESFPRVTRLHASPDLWWAGATNVGIRAALHRASAPVMLLNNDCYVDEDTIGALMDHARQNPNAVIAPVQRELSNGRYISITPGESLLLGFATTPGPTSISAEMRAQRLIPTRLIGGGRGVIIPSALFSRIGFLDEAELPHYYADHDFYLRCRDAGVPLRVAVDAEVAIDDARTSEAKDMAGLTWSEFRSSLTSMRSHRSIAHLRCFFRKHYPIQPLYPVGVALYLARYLVVYTLARLRRRIRGGD